MHNLYQILGVNKSAPTYAIKKAYRDKALYEHPDKGGNAQKMALLTTAYQTLSDPVERKKFDQEWEIFCASHDTEIPLTPSGNLPTAGIPFSKSFRQQHVQLVGQYQQKPLDQNQSSSCLKTFHSDLYSCTNYVAGDLFSFIKTKKDLETKLNIESLTPERAVEYFINFLQGDYSGNSLQDLSKAFYQKIKQLETLSQQADYEFQLYHGIYEVLLVAVKEKIPTAKILFSLHKITEYAKHNADQSMGFMAPLLQNKYFRSLFSQALHYYWLSEESILDESYAKTFNGQAVVKSLIERLKSQLSENRSASKSNDQVANLLRYAHLLLRLEKDLSKRADIIDHAAFHREKAFHLLDWLPALMGFAEHAITVNTLLQAGITLQKAAAQESDSILSMADEKLAAKIYSVAVGISHHATPDIELYTCIHSVKCLLSCRYTYSEFKVTLEALQHRMLWLADLFPFFQAPQSNADFLAQEDKTLILMRQLLHVLINKIDDPKSAAEKSVIDHSYVRVFYQAYEACLKNWYQKNHDSEMEKKFRQRLMQELLVSKQWKVDDLNYNLNAPWPLTNLDKQGWTRPKSVLPLAKEANVPTYKTIHGIELNYKTGKMAFILDYCEKNESDHNRLLTLFDLNELFQRRLTSAIFSLDPVDPDMPYHPFNQMRFAPSTLYHSQLLHTMLLTDYLLKFLTVGQEVQRCDPYELRSLDKITCKLPDHLKKIIDDFHASHHEESLNRFWIESEEIELAIDDEGLSKDGDVLFALGDIRMVVKHHKLRRDAEGHLVDKEGEDEGWDCYILTQEQKQELYDGKRIIADPALIVIQESLELIFWENHKATYHFTLEEDKQNLIRLSKQQRDDQEKVKIDDSESLRQVYNIVLKAAKKTSMPHNYSPEFIFAQEFTKHYNEFAIYFPEFGRLRELSKAATLVNVMAAQRTANQEEIHLIKKRLNYKQFCDLQSYSRRSKEQVVQKRQKSLDDIRQKIGPLKFTKSSPEVQDICNSSYDKIKSDYIDRHSLLSWGWYSTISCNVRREVIEPQIPKFIADLEAQKKAAGREQLLKKFEDELAELPEATQLVDRFLEGDDRPLREYLVSYDKELIDKKIKEVYPEQPIDIDDYWQTMRQKLKEIVGKGITKQFEEWQKQLSKEKIKQKRHELLNNLRQQIGTLYFTESSPEIRDICDRCYDEIKNDIIAEHGYSGWNSVSHKVYREAIRPKIPKFIADLEAQKRAACHKQLSELFKDELSGSEASQLVDKFLEGDVSPLRKRLVYYDREQVAKKIKEIYPEHTTHSLDKALNSSPPIIDKIVKSETKKALEEHKRQLETQLSGREKLEQSFVDLGFATDIEEVDLEGTCLWVPASFRHDVERGHSRAVYGGVHIAGMAYRSINQEHVKILLRQTRTKSKGLWQNKIRGDTLSAFCAEFLTKLLSSDSRIEVKERYRVETPFGLRILDIVVGKIGKNGEFEPVVGYEIKAGDSAYIRPDSKEAEIQGKKPTKQGKKDVWIEKEKGKEEKGTSFPIHCVRVEELNKDYCKVQ